MIFRASPVFSIAMILGFWAGENINSMIVAKMKIWTKGAKQGFRYILSTFLGQTVDNFTSVIFILIMANVFTAKEAFSGAFTAIVFCTIWEIIALPVTYKAIKFIKKAEGLDTYDYGTKLNPFSLKS